MFKRSVGKGCSVPGGIAFGIGLSVLITILCAGLLAWLLNAEKMQLSSVGWGAVVILFFASFLGGLLASRLAKVNRIPVSLAVGVGYILVLLGTTALLFGGQYQGIAAAAITVFLGSGCAGLLEKKSKKKAFAGNKIHAYR